MPWLRRTLHTALCAALLGSLTLVTAQPAAAVGSGWQTVFSDLFGCVKASAAITRWVPGTFSANHATGDGIRLGYDLNRGCTRPATGQGRVRVVAQFLNGDDLWQFCRGSADSYGEFGWRGGELPGPYGPSVILDYGGASCGATYYRTLATVEYLKDGRWVPGPPVAVASPRLWVD